MAQKVSYCKPAVGRVVSLSGPACWLCTGIMLGTVEIVFLSRWPDASSVQGDASSLQLKFTGNLLTTAKLLITLKWCPCSAAAEEESSCNAPAEEVWLHNFISFEPTAHVAE